MDDAAEISRLRERTHDLADKLGAAVTRTEVVATQMENARGELGRIATAMEQLVARERERNGTIANHSARISAIQAEQRAIRQDVRTVGQKWGGGFGAAGGFVGGFFSGFVQHWLGGSR